MTAIHAPGLLTFTIAILVFFAGALLNRLIEPLRRWNIPEPVTGGLIAADAGGLCCAGRRDQLHTRRARHAAALFLHWHRSQRQVRRSYFRRPSASRPAGSDPNLSGDPESDRGRQRRRARSARGDHAVRRFRLAHRRTWHHDRLGANHHPALRPRECARSRHRDRDAWVGRRKSGRRPDRRLPHRALPTQRTVSPRPRRRPARRSR
jgi:hypothetical protein